MSLQNLRRTYTFGELRSDELNPDPMVQFELWLKELSKLELPEWFEVNAMTLSTSDGFHAISSRIVLLKQLDSGFVFFSNYESEKAKQLSLNPHASLVFYWAPVDRQVRVEGVVEKVSSQLSDEYFQMRPLTSRLGAIVSPQSSVISEDLDLEQQLAAMQSQYQSSEPERPKNWGGYRLIPKAIEFWQGKPSRLHDRYRYQLSENGSWQIDRLAP